MSARETADPPDDAGLCLPLVPQGIPGIPLGRLDDPDPVRRIEGLALDDTAVLEGARVMIARMAAMHLCGSEIGRAHV